MPTELTNEIGETLQREGREYGTVTNRPRRCGWFDAQLVRFTTQLNGVTELALTKLDVLDTLPTVKICVGYQRGDTADQNWQYWEGDATWLGENQPVYIELDGWQQPTSGVRDFTQLPPNAQDYVRKIEKLVGVPVKFGSVGPARKETIIL
jgi:adenylosuccinate synthase